MSSEPVRFSPLGAALESKAQPRCMMKPNAFLIRTKGSWKTSGGVQGGAGSAEGHVTSSPLPLFFFSVFLLAGRAELCVFMMGK